MNHEEVKRAIDPIRRCHYLATKLYSNLNMRLNYRSVAIRVSIKEHVSIFNSKHTNERFMATTQVEEKGILANTLPCTLKLL